jgi:hypothetical protein
MSVSGRCTVCETREARHGCDRCGALVCDEHFERSQGLCVECASGGGGRRVTGSGSDGSEDLLGDGVNR